MTTYQKYKLVILTVFGAIALVILYNYSENGRYVFANSDYVEILDTRKGIVYDLNDKHYKNDYPKGKIQIKKINE